MTTPTATDASPLASTARRPWYDRQIASVVVLAAALFALAQLVAPGGYLSTDVGGKLATLEVMAEDGLREPDLGYWAEAHDPDGSLYPMWSSTRLDGRWVNVTTVPMLVVAFPLYELGGPRLAVLVPVLGTVLAAAAARALAGRLGGDRVQRRASFWLVGAASPATIYALDIWEHSLGLGLMLWGVVATLRASQRSAPLAASILAGLAFGAAASMRQEALVYGFVAGVALVGRLGLAGAPLDAARRGMAMVLGAVGTLAANALLEVFVFGAMLRTGRGTGTARAAGNDALLRVKEAVLTGASPFPADRASTYAVACLLAVLLVTLALRAEHPPEDRRLIGYGLVAVTALVLFDIAVGGLSFVPGMLATTPLAAVGLARGWRRGPTGLVTGIAVAALPLVWLTQFTGGAGPQWGGRYILTTGALLLVVGVVSLDRVRAGSTLRLLVAAGAVVTVVGVVWTVQRTHAFAAALEDLAERPEPVLVFNDPFLAREAGTQWVGEQWLVAHGRVARVEAVAVLEAAGISEAGFVDYEDGSSPRDLPGWRQVGDTRVDLLNGLEIRVSTWQAP